MQTECILVTSLAAETQSVEIQVAGLQLASENFGDNAVDRNKCNQITLVKQFCCLDCI